MKIGTKDKIAISVAEAADLISVSKTKMYEIMKQDNCDFCIRLGGRVLISRAKLEAWVERHCGGYENE